MSGRTADCTISDARLACVLRPEEMIVDSRCSALQFWFFGYIRR